MEINDENDYQISDGMEYPPSYKERDLIDPPIDSENSKPISKETSLLPNFGKNPPKPEKTSDYKNLSGNSRKNNISNDNEINVPQNPGVTRPLSSNKKDNSSGKTSKPIQKTVEQNEYNNFLEDSFSKLRLINNQMAIMQAQKSKQAKPNNDKNDNSLLEQFKAISYAYSNSQQKIVELEESLRVETINSEEQRAYIEVLKAALESKINDLGLMNFIKETAKYSKTNHLDLFMHFQNLKQNIDNQSNETKSHETRIMELEAFIDGQQNELNQLKITNQELMDFNAKINADIENSIKGLSQLDEENKKLKNEKNHVLDYLDEMTQKTEKMERALEEAMLRLKEKDDFINNLQREIASLHKHIQALESSQANPISRSKGNNNNADASSELLKELEMLKKKYQELINRPQRIVDEGSGDLKRELDRLARENNNLKSDLEREKRRPNSSNEKRDREERRDPLESTLGSTQEKINTSSPYKEKSLDRSFGKDGDNIYKKENDFLKRENENLRHENDQIKLQNSNLMRSLDDNQRKKNAPLDDSFRKRDMEKDLDRLSSENRDLKRKINELQDRKPRDFKKQQPTQRTQKSASPFKEEKEENSNSEINASKIRSPGREENERDLKSSAYLKRDLDNELIEDLKGRLEREREQKSKEVKEIYDNLSNTRSELRDAKEEINGYILKVENLENDVKTCQDLIDKKQKLLEQGGQEVADLKKTLESKNSEINALNKRGQNAKNEITELQNMVGHWEKQLRASNSEREGLVKDLKELNEENYRLKGQIKDLNSRIDENKKINNEANERVKDYENKLKSLQGNMRSIVQGIRRDILEGKKVKGGKTYDENITIEEVMREIKENFNTLADENEKMAKVNKELGESLKENEQTNLKKLEDMKNDNVALYQEVEKLTEDNNYLAEEITKLKQENNNLAQELEDHRIHEEENLHNDILNLEDKLVKITLEKNQFEFLCNICKRFIFNGEVSDLVNELKIVLSTFNTYEKQRISLEKLYEDLKNSNENDLNNSYYEISKRRKMDDYKDQLSEIETNIKIQESKREILENELIKLENFENNRYRNISNLEKMHNQLKNEINILNNELEMKEMSKKNIENAYNDLLNDYKKISEDTKKTDYVEKYSEYQVKKESYRATDKYNSFSETRPEDGNKRTEDSSYRFERKYKKYNE